MRRSIQSIFFQFGIALTILMAETIVNASSEPVDDPFIYLEQATSPQAINWVKDQNAITVQSLTAEPRFEEVKGRLKALYANKDRLPVGDVIGGYVYEVTGSKGVWRRSKFEDYPNEDIPWEVLIDFKSLSEIEGEDWAFSGVRCLMPAAKRCLLELSRGGKDSIVIREFDVATKTFVRNGFVLPEAMSSVEWVDIDTLLLGTDWGPGSLSPAGYPLQVRLWKRGTSWQNASMVYQGGSGSIAAGAVVFGDSTGQIELIFDSLVSEERKHWIRSKDGSLVPLEIPLHANVAGFHQDRIILRLDSDLVVENSLLKSGSIVAFDPKTKTLDSLYSPTISSSVNEIFVSSQCVVINVIDNIVSRMYISKLTAQGWQNEELKLPSAGISSLVSANPIEPLILISFSNFLTPTSIYSLDPGSGSSLVLLKKGRSLFDTSKFTYEQHFASSRDGTSIPYFMVHRTDMKMDAGNPTVLKGYGGFGESMLPVGQNLGTLGVEWLKSGGVFVLANIRGGGEFGPSWHQAAIKHNRQKAYDDFIAVSEDLIARGVTSPNHLGIMGASNGGLLVGAVMVQRPELFNAVISEVPLLDMVRFPQLGAGSIWVREYGDPNDSTDLAALLSYSPYHNLKPGTSYPRPFFITSTNDDRVTPAHARKMAAKMASYGEPYYFYESASGGHGGSVTDDDRANLQALQYMYLYQRLFNCDL